jgi:hypothetical protein
MSINYFDQFTDSRSKIKNYILSATVLIHIILSFAAFFTPNFSNIKGFLAFNITNLSLFAFHYLFIAPLLSKRVSILFFIITLFFSTTLFVIFYLVLFETNILQYPDFITNNLIPIRMKATFFICVSFVVFFAARFLFLFLNTFQLSSERFEYLMEGYTKEINEMRMQSNPFFLYASLQNLNHLLEIEEFDKALQYNSELSALLNMQLKHSKTEFITIEEDLEWMKYYFETQQLLSKENFEYKIEISDLDLYLQFIPPLLLQPIIENFLIRKNTNKNKHNIGISIEELKIKGKQGAIIKVTDTYNNDDSIEFSNTLAFYNLEKRIDLINKVNQMNIQLKNIKSESETSYVLTIIEKNEI